MVISIIIGCSILGGFIGLIIEENVRNNKERKENIGKKPNIPLP